MGFRGRVLEVWKRWVLGGSSHALLCSLEGAWGVHGGAWGAWGWGRRERRILRSVALCYECNSPSGVFRVCSKD